MSGNPTKLYIHVPFCHSKCAYCDFYSTPRRELMEQYIHALSNEWSNRNRDDLSIDTIYIGGGTPSSLPIPLLDKLMMLLPYSHLMREFTIEANPEDITNEWAYHISHHTPIDRVSMGIQSFSDDELHIISRRHSAIDAINAYHRLRENGIKNISCDLIYGLPKQTLASWKHSLDTLVSLRPEHISAYLLSYENGTRLSAMLSSGKIIETDEETIMEMYQYLCDTLRGAGYGHYEISNFALPGKRAIHNSSYWDGSPYIGLGPGAYSWDGTKRSYNPSNLKNYIKCKGIDFNIVEEETKDNRFNDCIMTGLRTSNGVSLSEIEQNFGIDILNEMVDASKDMIKEGYIHISNDEIMTIPEEHWLISNSIIIPLIRI